jgi:predicted MFS family arabinose efflux permease
MKSFRLFTYENGVMLLLGFTFGLIFFDRNAVGVLTPFIVDDLGLSNAQLGMLSSGLALAWALSSYLIGAWSDKSGARKPFLLLSIIVFSVCSALSGLAGSFLFLLLARLVMGLAEGPFLPISLSIMNVESSPGRRGINAGIMQNVFASLLGTTLAPILLVWLAERFGWRAAFYLTIVPGLFCAFLVWQFVREPRTETTPAGASAHKISWSALRMLKEHNIRVCAAIAVFMVAWFLVGLTFLPVFFTNFRGFTPAQMSGLIAPIGLSTMLCGFLVPALSDRVGRRPVMIIFCFMGMVTPLAALWFDGPLWLMSVLLFIGWSGTGAFPLFMGVVPGETVPRAMAATAMGLVVCIGELVGGFGAPWVAGLVADQTSLAAPVIAVAVFAFCGGLCSLLLHETAPGKVAPLPERHVVL